jgi:hypothetical protein
MYQIEHPFRELKPYNKLKKIMEVGFLRVFKSSDLVQRIKRN